MELLKRITQDVAPNPFRGLENPYIRPLRMRSTNLSVIRHIIRMACFFAIGNVALRLLGEVIDTGAVSLNLHTLYTAVYWAIGGGVIGYLSWRFSKHKGSPDA